MKQTEIRFNLDGLGKMTQGMAKTYRARVGVLGANAARTEGGPLNNAEIGLIQMFGSISNNIPPRDFLRMPIETHQREILKAMQAPAVKDAFKRGDYKRVFELLGVTAEQFVQMAFETGGFGQWPPHAPGTEPHALLIDTGQLRRAVSSDVVKASSVGAP